MSRLTATALAMLSIVAFVALNVLAPKGLVSAPSPAASPWPASEAVPTGLAHVPFVPATQLPDPPGANLPGDLVGRTYAVDPPEQLDGRQLLLTLRGAEDPHCMAMYGGRSTCFTVLWSPAKPEQDPGARGPARIVDGRLMLGFAIVPYDQVCVGSSATYAYEDAGQTLRGIDTPTCTFPGFRQLGATAAASNPWVFDTRTIADEFALGMKITVPGGWKPLHGLVGALSLVHTGYPEGPDSTWWGPDILLVDEAQVHDPTDVVSSEPATPDRKRFVAWPADFFSYITALSGVTVVSGPEPVTIGGVAGKQAVVMTPQMHPLVWLNGDTNWIGGGPTGVDPAMERRFILLLTGGHMLLVTYADDPTRFDGRNAELQVILDSISFD